MTAYYVASQAVVYIVERFGFAKVPRDARGVGQGQRTREVFEQRARRRHRHARRATSARYTKQRLHKYDDDFYVDFARYEDVDALEAAVQRAPDDADAQAALALGLVARGRFDEAEKAAKALATQRAQGHPLAQFALTRVALEQRRRRAAPRRTCAASSPAARTATCCACCSRAPRSPSGDTAKARREAEAAIAIDPEQLEGYRVLLEIARASSRDKQLGLRALRALADLDQHDRVVHLALMVALRRRAASTRSWSRPASARCSSTPASRAVHATARRGLPRDRQAQAGAGRARPRARAQERPEPRAAARTRARAARARPRPEARAPRQQPWPRTRRSKRAPTALKGRREPAPP